jgi:hypothetical protein
MLSARGADPESIAVLFKRCINSRNIEALTHLMTDDHTFIDTEGSAVSGRQGCRAAWQGFFEAGFVPTDYAVMLRWLTGTIISGNGSRPNDDIEKVTGRPPIIFQDFARRNAHAWNLQAAK